MNEVITIGVGLAKNVFQVHGVDAEGELHPRVGFIVTNLSRSAERVTWFYNQRGKAEQYIKESGAVHQGRQERHQVDPIVVPQVPR